MLIPLVMVLDRALRDAGIPIDGVSVADPGNRATWRVFYAASATASQRTQGDALVLTIDPQDAVTLNNIRQDIAAALTAQDVIFALGQALWEAIPAPATTLAQTRTRFMQLLKARL